MRRLVAQRQECRDRAVEDESVAEGFSGQQELEQKAQAAAVSHAGVQAVEACSTSQAATLQTGTACENRDAEADKVIHCFGSPETTSEISSRYSSSSLNTSVPPLRNAVVNSVRAFSVSPVR